ncbi:C5a anaphylatoxin chemotactic receptor 1 [Notolabrus celidotus]|uniref:C5a anaphylatoxin chemotactic receptor 1 n=1 Tax=Notolabrus celidotus TaxID=1203425 RepID=UPI0014902B21|nr:C5a anaphylatoxin chemotactic receptor 1 [Notolabrus celidotus]
MAEFQDYDPFAVSNSTDNYIYEIDGILTPAIQPIQIAALVFYGLVVLLGVPGNALVVWVTGFCMPRSVTSLWFLNLALADLLCCLSIPLLMVPIAHDDHWHFGPLACTLVKSLFYLVMFCSILQLVLISVDRWLLVSRPVWCQNKRRPKPAAFMCVAIWCLAFLGSIPGFVYTREIKAGEEKRECRTEIPTHSAWLVTSFRFVVGFFLPFLVIIVCHWVVYCKAESGLSRGRTRSKRTLRVIIAVVLSFFLCLLPLHIVDFIDLITPRNSTNSPTVYLAQVLTLCLAYFNSCLNPLLYVCLGRGFKDSMNRSLRSILHFISEDPSIRVSITNNDTKSTSNEKETTKI